MRTELLLISFAVSAMACSGPECFCNISPHVWIDACAEPQHKVGGEVVGGVEDCAVDFGVVDGPFAAERVVRFSNPAKVPLELELVLEGGDAFAIATGLTEVAPGFSEDAVFRVAPLADGSEESARVIVTSNATNYLGDTIEIDLRARGPLSRDVE